MMYYETMQWGFIVLSPDLELSLLSPTISSIKNHYPGAWYSIICLDNANMASVDQSFLKKINENAPPPIYKAKDTIASMINVGLCNSKCQWNILVNAGVRVRSNLDKKYSYFVKDEQDVLFPIVDRKMNFVQSSIHGVLIHKNTFDKVGNFPSNRMFKANDNFSELELAKTFWCNDAIAQGCRFKGILGCC